MINFFFVKMVGKHFCTVLDFTTKQSILPQRDTLFKYMPVYSHPILRHSYIFQMEHSLNYM